MLAAQSIQVLPALTDQANLYVGLNVNQSGRATTLLSSPGLIFNPSGNLLTVSNVVVSGFFSLGKASITSDSSTGALALLPSISTNTISPQAAIVLPNGGLSLALIVNGQISTSSYATAVTNAANTGAPIGSLVKVYNFIGTIVVGTGTTRWYPQSNVNLIMCYLTAGVAPSAGAFSINLNKNGTLIQTINLVSGNYNTTPILLNITGGTTDYFTVDVITSGGASNGALNIVYQRTS
jgi:hypothetical protein